ncbi:MAG: TlpA family protein disulfide reductase [Bacteroidia bacterium]
MRNIILIFFLLVFVRLSAQDFKVSVVHDKEKSKIEKPYKYSGSNYFNLFIDEFDTTNYKSTFWIKDRYNIYKKWNNQTAIYTPIFDNAYAHYEICDKLTNSMLAKDSILLTFENHPKFKEEWKTLNLTTSEFRKFSKKLDSDEKRLLYHYRFEYRWIGKRLNDFKTITIDSNKISNKDLEGKITLIEFTSLACGPCIIEEKSLDSLSLKYKNSNVNFVMVYNFLNNKKIEADKTRNTNFILINDDKLHKNFEIQGLPSKFFIDKNGVIREVFLGGLVYDKDGRQISKYEVSEVVINFYSNYIDFLLNEN